MNRTGSGFFCLLRSQHHPVRDTAGAGCTGTHWDSRGTPPDRKDSRRGEGTRDTRAESSPGGAETAVSPREVGLEVVDYLTKEELSCLGSASQLRPLGPCLKLPHEFPVFAAGKTLLGDFKHSEHIAPQ